MLDDAITFLARDSRPAAERLLIDALETASSLDTFSERGRVVPEWTSRPCASFSCSDYRLLYEVMPDEVQILAFVHGARDLTRMP